MLQGLAAAFTAKILVSQGVGNNKFVNGHQAKGMLLANLLEDGFFLVSPLLPWEGGLVLEGFVALACLETLVAPCWVRWEAWLPMVVDLRRRALLWSVELKHYLELWQFLRLFKL